MTNHQKRDNDPADFDSKEVSNAWEHRIYLLGKLIKEIGIPTIIILFVGLVYTGYLPSQLTAIANDLHEHKNDVSKIVEQRSREQAEFISAIKSLTAEMYKQNQRVKIKECAEIKDLDLRRECLK